MELVDHIDTGGVSGTDTTRRLMRPESSGAPSADGLVEQVCECIGNHRGDCRRVIAPLQGQPPRARGGNWGPAPKSWRS